MNKLKKLESKCIPQKSITITLFQVWVSKAVWLELTFVRREATLDFPVGMSVFLKSRVQKYSCTFMHRFHTVTVLERVTPVSSQIHGWQSCTCTDISWFRWGDSPMKSQSTLVKGSPWLWDLSTSATWKVALAMLHEKDRRWLDRSQERNLMPSRCQWGHLFGLE